jgi:hypothetical protein
MVKVVLTPFASFYFNLSSPSGIAKHDRRYMQLEDSACKVIQKITDLISKSNLIKPFSKMPKGVGNNAAHVLHHCWEKLIITPDVLVKGT